MDKIFLSYSRTDQEAALVLEQDISELGQGAWMDHQLSGGQVWWEEILEQIRACDIFVFLLSEDSLYSQACKLEWEYAYALRKRIVPILVAGQVSINLLPPALSAVQFVDYRQRDRAAVIGLSRAFLRLPSAQPLPDPLPAPPAPPISYLSTFKDRITGSASLTFADQSELVLKLRGLLEDPEQSEDARDLLSRLRRRDDLLAKIRDEIDAALSQIGTSSEGAKETTLRRSVPPPFKDTDGAESRALEFSATTQSERSIKPEPTLTINESAVGSDKVNQSNPGSVKASASSMLKMRIVK